MTVFGARARGRTSGPRGRVIPRRCSLRFRRDTGSPGFADYQTLDGIRPPRYFITEARMGYRFTGS